MPDISHRGSTTRGGRWDRGCVLAARLSEASVDRSAARKGGAGRDVHQCAAGTVVMAQRRSLNWASQSVPSRQLTGRRISVLETGPPGGSACQRHGLFQRQPGDYDAGVCRPEPRLELTGDRAVNSAGANTTRNYAPACNHGSGGQMNVSHVTRPNLLQFLLFYAARRSRHTTAIDIEAAVSRGMDCRQLLDPATGAGDETRQTPLCSRARGRPNLTVVDRHRGHLHCTRRPRADGRSRPLAEGAVM